MYSGSSPLLGQGQATADQLDAWFRQHNPSAPPLGVATIDNVAALKLNSDLVAAQIALETGYWTSQIAHDKNNPAGIGAVNDNAYNGAITFPTPSAGIHAQVAHLGSYILGNQNPLKADDPRFSAMPASYLGSVHVLSDLDGKWAVPGVGYGQHIASIANDLLASLPKGQPMASDDPKAQWEPSSNFDTGRGNCFIDHVTCHGTYGAVGGNSLNWLRGKAGGSSNTDSSATYLISRAGEEWQMVREADTAWADGNLLYNQSGVSIEFEHAAGQDWPEAQITAGIGLIARISQRQGWQSVNHPTAAVLPEGGPPGKGSIIGHSQVPNPNNAAQGGGISAHTGCPGDNFPFARIIAGVNAALSGKPAPVAQATTNADDTARTFPETGKKLSGGFYAFWKQFGGLDIFGLPLTDELKSDAGMTYQYLERARFEWHPGSDPKRFDVMLGRVGAELLKLIGGK